MDVRLRLKRAIPPCVLNNVLLWFPFLYRTRLVNYETNLQNDHGLEDLLRLLEPVLGLEGDIIECGSSRAGTSIIMACLLRSRGVHKRIYACDSFRGFDAVELEKERQAGLTVVSPRVFTSSSYLYVRRKIAKLGYTGTVIPIEGYFQDTLPKIGSDFCFALVDCDLKESIQYCAETVWPRLRKGGCMAFDDYTSEEFRGARAGIDSFVEKQKREFSAYGLLNRLYYVCKM